MNFFRSCELLIHRHLQWCFGCGKTFLDLGAVPHGANMSKREAKRGKERQRDAFARVNLCRKRLKGGCLKFQKFQNIQKFLLI
jgi:hypothetical protein